MRIINPFVIGYLHHSSCKGCYIILTQYMAHNKAFSNDDLLSLCNEALFNVVNIAIIFIKGKHYINYPLITHCTH